ncbi:helicase [Microbacterium sp. Gd 4-13]|uniref:ATP-dependent DNA helicase n=1 Tax=Microbacterium sp. Gd 4-13 TaxID=2173179 RepID=UPI000D56816C|nr:AAA family ATPase [Microbacterium sp. Gd 4-13]PVW05431.1 helicase [Microbacterium sp. Gd 4-13]
MATVTQQVLNADSVIAQNIETWPNDRGFLSQNVLSQLRNLVEGLLVWVASGDAAADFHWEKVGLASKAVRPRAKFRVLVRFHDQLQASVSHYTMDRDPSERLMLKYYEYMLRTRDLAEAELGVAILQNLQKFPLNTDPAMREYHSKIAARVDDRLTLSAREPRVERYYVHSSRPFFVEGRIYYEATFSVAHNRTNKFDRKIAFTDIDITDKYAANLELSTDTIEVFGRTMPITLIRTWAVSIRPCEFDNFRSLLAPTTGKVSTSQTEYRNLMQYLTTTRSSLLDLVDLTDGAYDQVRTWALRGIKGSPLIFEALDRARDLIRQDAPGSRVLRYLLLRMRNEVIKAQRESSPNYWMSGLRITSKSKPFDTMPFCTSPRGHNPRFADVLEAITPKGREHELLARRIETNVQHHGVIYTADSDLSGFKDLDLLIATYNGLLPPTDRHAPRKLVRDKGHVFIVGYEDGTVAIIDELQAISSSGVPNHSTNVLAWINANPNDFDDPLKSAALTALFEQSRVALIYGAAGTGKSTMVNHIARYFSNKQKLFLAHTNPAVDNLEHRVKAANSTFSTITSHVRRGGSGVRYDVLVIDECSTVSNASLLKVLETTSFDLLVLVGDVYQIESIEFGNWFSTIRSYIPAESVFELTKPFRTSDAALLTLWDRVRNLDDRIEEAISHSEYAAPLGDSLFEQREDDEIVLCLNYDGLYGINNVNRFLQASNPHPAVEWDEAIFKVDDPILFHDTTRFGDVIFNNLKGTIVGIQKEAGRITFDVDIDREVKESDVRFTDLRWLGNSVVQFEVSQRQTTDEDDDASVTLVPFQIAYAVSIHKAQGLEYDSVKVVITDANEENISHAILYTAITRARKKLKLYWSAEAQQRMLSRLAIRENSKDEALLRARRGVTPVSNRPKLAKSRGRI